MTPEEKYTEALAAIPYPVNTSLYQAEWVKIQRQLDADKFLENGDLTYFHKVQAVMMGNWQNAIIDYIVAEECCEAQARAIYLKDRVAKCSLWYEDELMRTGLTTGKLSTSEREELAMVSWYEELEAGLENIATGTADSCTQIIKTTRQYFYNIHTAFGVPDLVAVADIKPIFDTPVLEAVYSLPIEPYADVTLTQQQRDDYEADKNYTL